MRYALFLVLALGACDTGGLGFMNAPAQQVTIDGSDFTVRRRENTVEVLRTNSEWAFARKGMAQKMVAAIEATTGCAVAKGSLQGDQVMARARLACSKELTYAAPSAARDLDCKPPESATRDGVTTILTDLDCF
ncbi:hypothetical protein [Algirhabdus cladophorae]|uniref:hypothetical protein n=1 Tax=Algirhabdus cladophorae TaxID=3377108 RepID=UPI003B846214